jgi:ferric-dicitrate binding protein FerR (iron transport regulator)
MKEKNISDSLGEALDGYFKKKLTQSQAEELLEWLGKDEENKEYLLELEKIWYASSQLSHRETEADRAWTKLLDKIKKSGTRHALKSELRIPLSLLYRIAAAVLLVGVLGIGSVFIFRNPNTKSEISYFEALAPKGSRSFITLSDGSTVWLNSGTKLKYQSNFGKVNRDLFLEGEAYFVVVKNPAIPFRVKTSDVWITALGTAFNVKAYSEEGTIETTLEKGEVRIDALDDSKLKAVSSPVFLKPNQKAVFVRKNKNMSVNNTLQKPQIVSTEPAAEQKTVKLLIETMADTKLNTSWKDSRWIFKSEKMAELAPILERRYDISVIFQDSILRSYKFTGTIKEESLDQVLQAVCIAAPIRYEIRHNQVLFFEDNSHKTKYLKSLKNN